MLAEVHLTLSFTPNHSCLTWKDPTAQLWPRQKEYRWKDFGFQGIMFAKFKREIICSRLQDHNLAEFKANVEPTCCCLGAEHTQWWLYCELHQTSSEADSSPHPTQVRGQPGRVNMEQPSDDLFLNFLWNEFIRKLIYREAVQSNTDSELLQTDVDTQKNSEEENKYEAFLSGFAEEHLSAHNLEEDGLKQKTTRGACPLRTRSWSYSLHMLTKIRQ